MDKLLFATRMVSIGDETKQNDAELVSDIERLVNIINQCTEILGDFVLEVHVSPMNILQAKLKDVKKLKLSIVYNGQYKALEFMEKKNECTELLSTAIEDEFEGIKSIGKVDYSLFNDWDYPTLLLYTIFPRPTVKDLPYADYQAFQQICADGYCVSIPYTYKFQKVKTMYVHCADMTDYPVLLGNMNNSERQYRKKIDEFEIDKESYYDACYIPIIGRTPLQYNIPYVFISIDDFVEQENSSELK